MRSYFIFLCLLIFEMLYAQDIEVKKFEPMAKDQTAALSLKMDVDGNTSALIKVLKRKKTIGFLL